MDRRTAVTAAPAGSGSVIGADLGGTKFISGIVNADGRILARHRCSVPGSRSPEEVLRAVVESIDSCRREIDPPPRAVGIGVAGQIDPIRGTVRHAPNLHWQDFPLGSRLASELGLPVIVSNDAHTITLGEWKYGEGRGVDNFLCVCVGTGLGGGAIVDGRLLSGSANSAGEIGHTTFVGNGRPCHCPNRGCLEAYVGGWAIEERAQEAARAAPSEAAALLAKIGGIEHLTPHAIEKASGAGDRFARGFLAQITEEFAAGLVGLVNAFNPEVVVVTGKIAEGFPGFVTAGQEAVRQRCQPPAATARVVGSRLGADAGILGAATLAFAALPTGVPA